MKHLFIVNPVAGGRNGNYDDVKRKIVTFSAAMKDPVEAYVTKGPMDAPLKIIKEAEKLKTESTQDGNPPVSLYVYACGGDGTLCECINGAVGQSNVAVTQFPCGTGNDFLKTFSAYSFEKFRDLKALSKGTIKLLDVIECCPANVSDPADTERTARYGINICSVGIDARVGADVHKYSNIPIIGGVTGYNISLIVNVIKGVTQRFRITAGDRVFDKKITLACACNGRYYGGGFNPVPDAVPDDGLLDCLVVEPVSRLRVAQIVGKFSKGRFAEFPDVFHHIRCTDMEIEADREFVVNVDGERLYAKKIVFRLIPKAVNFIFPADKKIYYENFVKSC